MRRGAYGAARHRLAALLALSLAGSAAGQSPPSPAVERWTLEDIVTVPQVTALKLSSDGTFALAIVQQSDVAQNRIGHVLARIDTATGETVELLRAKFLGELRAIGRTGRWSLRADLGGGVQLYGIDATGATTPLLSRSPGALIGATDGAVSGSLSAPPRREGIHFHDWSPDGAWLYYSVIRLRDPSPSPVFGDAIADTLFNRRLHVPADIELRVRHASGADHLLAVRPISDALAFALGGSVRWQDGQLRYVTFREDAEGRARAVTTSVNLATMTSRTLPDNVANPYEPRALGPWGGALGMEEASGAQHLIERSANGRRQDHGRAEFQIGDPRNPGSWRSRDGKFAVIATRIGSETRFGLEWLARGKRRSIGSDLSLRQCDFDADLRIGICVREGITTAPHYVTVAPATGAVRPIAAVSTRHSAISPLSVTRRTWHIASGEPVTGFVLWPRDYRPAHRSPVIVITHGSDADQRFASPDLQWNYPAQVLAERGYVVVLINDPRVIPGSPRMAAYEQWMAGGTAIPRDQLQRTIWLDSVAGIDAALDDLVARGAVDPQRIGIAGYSRGSQIINVAMTHSTRFRAASSGDGSYLEPYFYAGAAKGYDTVFGGSPYGPAITEYRWLSPSLRANQGRGAVLQQIASPTIGMVDFHRALRAAGRPSALSLYRGEDARSDETHLFHVPSNRLLAMRENIAWFDYWLRGVRSPDMPFPEHFADWDMMATLVRSGACGNHIALHSPANHNRAQPSAVSLAPRRPRHC